MRPIQDIDERSIREHLFCGEWEGASRCARAGTHVLVRGEGLGDAWDPECRFATGAEGEGEVE